MPTRAAPLHFGFVLAADGRWNRPGLYGALYLAETQAAARAEYEKYQQAQGVTPSRVAKSPRTSMISFRSRSQ
ncbi:MAG: RES domain-containing protein [Gemmatimonadaceae bacterium]